MGGVEGCERESGCECGEGIVDQKRDSAEIRRFGTQSRIRQTRTAVCTEGSSDGMTKSIKENP